MASSYNYLFLFTITLSLTFLRPTSSSADPISPTSSSGDLFKDICSTARNPAFCLAFLNRPNFHPDMSLKDLANLTLRASKFFLIFARDRVHMLEIESSVLRSPLTEKYRQCGFQYIAAMNTIDQSEKVLQTGDYKTLPSLATIALEQIQACDLKFTPPGSEPAKFKTFNEKTMDVCSTVFAVTNRLATAGI